mmetsp:Transcript_18729/g.61150  ORF Transcript_18729/g.61150 Transcript_18729/m.61150 type:complete len:399 (+) Transcript_18729:3-1199(+)
MIVRGSVVFPRAHRRQLQQRASQRLLPQRGLSHARAALSRDETEPAPAPAPAPAPRKRVNPLPTSKGDDDEVVAPPVRDEAPSTAAEELEESASEREFRVFLEEQRVSEPVLKQLVRLRRTKLESYPVEYSVPELRVRQATVKAELPGFDLWHCMVRAPRIMYVPTSKLCDNIRMLRRMLPKEVRLERVVNRAPVLLLYDMKTLERNYAVIAVVMQDQDVAKVIERVPALLQFSPKSFLDNVANLYKLFPGHNLNRVMSRAPVLLTMRSERLAVNLNSIRNIELLKEVNAESLATKSPMLLNRNPERLRKKAHSLQKRIALNPVWEKQIAEYKVGSVGRLLECSEKRYVRLDHSIEIGFSASLGNILLSTDAKFEEMLEKHNRLTDRADEEAWADEEA